MTKEHKEEVQKLLKLMGIPYHDVRFLFLPDPALFAYNTESAKDRHRQKQKHNVRSFAEVVSSMVPDPRIWIP